MRPAGAEGILVGWMTKPVNPAELLAIVEKALADGAEVSGQA
jgi:DNA-binding response OmpR family regulator